MSAKKHRDGGRKRLKLDKGRVLVIALRCMYSMRVVGKVVRVTWRPGGLVLMIIRWNN
jgi:hypothetical protein